MLFKWPDHASFADWSPHCNLNWFSRFFSIWMHIWVLYISIFWHVNLFLEEKKKKDVHIHYCVWFLVLIRALNDSLTITWICCQDVKHKTVEAVFKPKKIKTHIVFHFGLWTIYLDFFFFWLWGFDSAINVIFLMF